MTASTPQWLQTVQKKRKLRDEAIEIFTVGVASYIWLYTLILDMDLTNVSHDGATSHLVVAELPLTMLRTFKKPYLMVK